MEEEQLVSDLVRTAKTVATIGAKGTGFAPAYTVPRRMQQAGIRIIPVNPTIATALGEPARRSIADVGERVDVVQVFRRREFLAGIADEVLALAPELRPRAVWFQSGLRDDAAAAKLRAAGIEVVQDRCFAVELAMHPRG